MRTKLYMIALAAISIILGSCSDSNSEFSQDYLADTPIKLNVSVDEPTTRAGYSNTEQPEGFGLIVQHSDSKMINIIIVFGLKGMVQIGKLMISNRTLRTEQRKMSPCFGLT